MPPSRTSQSLASLAERFGLELRGNGAARVDRVGTLADGGPNALTFLANRSYRDQLASTRAGAVILSEPDAADCPVPCFIAEDPYLAYARVAGCFDIRPEATRGIDASAQVHPDAELGADVAVGPCAVIGAGTRVEDGAEVGPGCVLAEEVTIGAGSRLVANVTIGHGVTLGKRVLIHPGAVIGADGFGIARSPEGWEKVPQLGSVQIGDDCEIGANTCIDRGAIGDTVLEEDVRLDNHVQIGHNCRIGAHTAMAAYVGISGSTEIGRNCLFAGRSGAHGHIRIADGVVVSAMTMVQKPITEPGTTWAGAIPAQPIREWHKILGELRRLRTTLTALRGNRSSEGKNQ